MLVINYFAVTVVTSVVAAAATIVITIFSKPRSSFSWIAMYLLYRWRHFLYPLASDQFSILERDRLLWLGLVGCPVALWIRRLLSAVLIYLVLRGPSLNCARGHESLSI